MTRGRKAQQTPIEPTQVNEVAIEQDMKDSAAYPVAVAQIQQNAMALAKDLAYEGELTVEALETEIKFYQRRSVEAVLEMGKRLLLLKEVAGHGHFIERIEELGIGYKMANKFMATTLKFSKVSSTRLFELPNMSQGKLLELLVVDTEEIEALNSGDEVRGIDLDDVDCMSVSELRRALRQAREDKEAAVSEVQSNVSASLAAKDKVIAEKSKRIAELVEEKNKREHFTTDERAQELEQQLNQRVLITIGSLAPIRQAINDMVALPDVSHGHHFALQSALDRVIAEAMAIAAEYGIQLSVLDEFSQVFSDPNSGDDLPIGAGPDGE